MLKTMTSLGSVLRLAAVAVAVSLGSARATTIYDNFTQADPGNSFFSSGTTGFNAQMFTTDAGSYTVRSLALYMRGDKDGAMTVDLFNDNGGLPGSSVYFDL